MTNTLFTNVNILDGNADGPIPGEVRVADGRIQQIATENGALSRDGARVIDGGGRTLMSGLCDAHTHFTWNSGGSLDALGGMPVEEHTIVAVQSARIVLDAGYTMCVGAASAKERIDIACRDAINAGMVPGPRYLASGQELATPAGVLVDGISRIVSGTEEMSRAVPRDVRDGRRDREADSLGRVDHRARVGEGHLHDRRGSAGGGRGSAPGGQAGGRPRAQHGIDQAVSPRGCGHRLPRELHRRRGGGPLRGAPRRRVRGAGVCTGCGPRCTRRRSSATRRRRPRPSATRTNSITRSSG